MVVILSFEVDGKLWEALRDVGPHRPQSDAKLEESTRQEVNMLKLDAVKPSQVPYYSHPHLTEKPDGSRRFCIKFR